MLYSQFCRQRTRSIFSLLLYVTFSKLCFGILSYFFIDFLCSLDLLPVAISLQFMIIYPHPFPLFPFCTTFGRRRMSLGDMLTCLTNVMKFPHLVVPRLSVRFYRSGCSFISFSHWPSALHESTDG